MAPRIARSLAGSRRALVATLLLSILSLLPLSGPATSTPRVRHEPPGSGGSSWQLVDNHQRACISTNSTTTYYGVWIQGNWNHAIDVGLDNLPSGATFTTSYAPIPPGSSTGVYSLAYVAAHVNRGTPLGTYTPTLSASDGASRQTVPVTLVVAESCRNY